MSQTEPATDDRQRAEGARWEDGWYVVPWQVIFRDVDAFGHVNNAVYLTYFEWARAQLWFALTGAAGVPTDIGFIVARAEIDFAADRWSRSISVSASKRCATRRSTPSTIRKRRTAWQRQLGRSWSSFDWKTQTKMPISDELRRKVQAFQQAA
jgi:hypothetical protein